MTATAPPNHIHMIKALTKAPQARNTVVGGKAAIATILQQAKHHTLYS